MLLIQNAHVIDPASGRSEECDILVQGERIAQIGKSLPAPEGECGIIDARGLVAAPGLVDVHVHFREPGLRWLIRRIFTQVPPPLPGEVLPLW